MSNFTRRQLLRMGAGIGLMPMVPKQKAVAGMTTESRFAQGGMKGFCLGSVKNVDIDYFSAFLATGANVGRIFFPFEKCATCDRFGRSLNNLDALRRILDWARSSGVQLVLVGDFSGVDQPEFWTNKPLRESFVENWNRFARTIGNDPAIAGLDLLNEPNPLSPSRELIDAHPMWQPLAESAIAAIRAEGGAHPIIYEGVGGGASVGMRDMKPLKDSRVVYSIHHYLPHEITHQNVYPTWPRTLPYPADREWQLGGADGELGITAYDRHRMEKDLRHAIAFQKRYQVPIYVGEFSCVRWAPNGSRTRYIADCLEIFRKFGWSWTYHEFRGWPGWDAEIDSELRSATARSMDAPVMRMLRNEIQGVARRRSGAEDSHG